tara:strand:- start:6785 stop:6931 length:147 start_codon:yes stop_codon:yes gene_type:complete
MIFQFKKSPKFKGKHSVQIVLAILVTVFVLIAYFHFELINLLKAIKSN